MLSKLRWDLPILVAVCTLFACATALADDFGNTSSTATGIAPNSATRGVIETPTDRDFFRIALPTGGSLTVRTEGSLDTIGNLISSSGTLIEENDDRPGNRNFSITRTLTAGTYFISVRSYGGATGAYTLNASFASNAPVTSTSDDHANSLSGATRILVGQGADGVIETAGDRDFFVVDTPGAGNLTFRTEGSLDTVGQLLDGNGLPLGNNDDNAFGRNFRISTTANGGTRYYVVVSAYGGSTGAYRLVVDWQGATPAVPPSTPALASPEAEFIPDGDEVVGILVFPANLNPNTNFTARFNVPDHFRTLRIEQLKTAQETATASEKLIHHPSTTDLLMVPLGAAIPPGVGVLVSGAQVAIDFQNYFAAKSEIARVLEETTKRDVLFVNPRGKKYLVWLRRTGAGTASPTFTVTGNFQAYSLVVCASGRVGRGNVIPRIGGLVLRTYALSS